MYHNFWIHSFADGHLGCFQYLAIELLSFNQNLSVVWLHCTLVLFTFCSSLLNYVEFLRYVSLKFTSDFANFILFIPWDIFLISLYSNIPIRYAKLLLILPEVNENLFLLSFFSLLYFWIVYIAYLVVHWYFILQCLIYN